MEKIRVDEYEEALNNHAIVSAADEHGNIIYVNDKFVTASGYSREELLGKSHRMMKSGVHDHAFYQLMWDTIKSGQVWRGEVCNHKKNGDPYWCSSTITPIKDANGKIFKFVAIRTDITQLKVAEKEINTLAFYDHLTGLPNRRLLLDRLQQSLHANSRSNHHGALMFIDLDNFKQINDTMGHDSGDELLKQVAHRLLACVRYVDTVARFGGDEFLILVNSLGGSAPVAAEYAAKVGNKIVSAFKEPFEVNGYLHHTTPSIGISIFTESSELSVEDVLKRADLAMYDAKSAGKNGIKLFETEMQEHLLKQAALEAELRNAVVNNKFTLYYQPQVDEHNRVVGAEVLLRWFHPVHGIIPASDFIPLAESTGLILPLGHWVLQEACAQLARWQTDSRMCELNLAVNVSTLQFSLPNFVEEVASIIEYTRIDATKLKLELTESTMVHDVIDMIEKMTALHDLGIQISLDDFGTGYSSLMYLKKLPITQLKIDQSFVHDVLEDANDATITKTIIMLAHTLGISVIAEGVETDEQRQFLEDNDCKMYQGYLFSRPVSLAKFEKLVAP